MRVLILVFMKSQSFFLISGFNKWDSCSSTRFIELRGIVSSCQNTLRLFALNIWNKVLLGVVKGSVAVSHME